MPPKHTTAMQSNLPAETPNKTDTGPTPTDRPTHVEENDLIGLTHEEVPYEVVRYLPECRMKADSAFHARIEKDGRHGLVDAIGHGTQSGHRLYRIRFDEGDFEHVTIEYVHPPFHEPRSHGVSPSR